MLKKLLNTPERITYGRLCEVCTRHNTAVYAKVRLADVLPIEGSGLSAALYEFALLAHFDFVITGRDQVPLFAIEFDGPLHTFSPQAERDVKKDELSRRFRLPLMRVHAEDLCRNEWQLDKLTESIDRWFENHAELATGVGNMQVTPKCPVCGGEMIRKRGKYGPFLSCVRYPACTGTCDLPGTPIPFIAKGRRNILIACSICAAVVVAAVLLLNFQFGTPQGAGQQPPNEETTPAVRGTRSAMTLPEQRAYARALEQSDYPVCPHCGKRMVLRNNAQTGDPFFGCSEFPRCRGTRDVQYPK
jgi:ssDNA-binding Zn-finger/Zn-ribbon topoisomerase 1